MIIENIKEIRDVKDCVGLKSSTKVRCVGRDLIYAGITKHILDNKISHRMICEEEGEPVQYRINPFNEVHRLQITEDNPLYYPYKTMLGEAKKNDSK